MVTAQQWAFPSDGWRTFQALMFNAATADPATLPIAIVLLERHIRAGQIVNKSAARKAIEQTIARHAPLGHGSEVAWALWTAVQFDVDLSEAAAASVSAMEDDVVALLALDAMTRGRFSPSALDTTRWLQLVGQANSLNEEHWLLAYEANRQAWLPCAAVASHPFFSLLEQNRISFYDPAKRLAEFKGAAAAVPGGVLGAGYA